MNNDELQLLLSDTNALKQVDQSRIEQVLKQYPYFQTAWVLSARNAQLQNDPSFEKRLNQAAVHAVDRIQLYSFLHQDESSTGVTVQNEETQIPKEQPVASTPSTESELDALLRSIHERKQIILDASAGEIKISERETESIATSNEPAESEKSSVQTGQELQHNEPPADHLNADRKDELILMNETAGGGSEYVPLQEMLSEETEAAWVEEQDPEMASMSVIEEEFILSDLDHDIRMQAIGDFAETVNPMQLEPENPGKEELPGDLELEAWKTMEVEVLDKAAQDRKYELEWLNQQAGGGSEFVPLDLMEDPDLQETVVNMPEIESIQFLESGPPEEMRTAAVAENEAAPKEKETSLHFSEHVPSPGKFLPGKAYSFLDWLKFFKPENQSQGKQPPLKQEAMQTLSSEEAKETAGDIGTIGNNMTEELSAIDRIVSTMRHDRNQRRGQEASAEDLARKSVEMDDELITETLAAVYEAQGLIEKAIRMYARLSLKYPEKSLFFAARIQALKAGK